MAAGERIPCQWMELGSPNLLVTAIVTVSPSRQRRIGPGTEPLTAVAVRATPVKSTGTSSTVSLKLSPLRTPVPEPLPIAIAGQHHECRPASAAPLRAPWIKRRRVTPPAALPVPIDTRRRRLPASTSAIPVGSLTARNRGDRPHRRSSTYQQFRLDDQLAHWIVQENTAPRRIATVSLAGES